jgi:hypothetical protein
MLHETVIKLEKVGLQSSTETGTGVTGCAENKILQLRDERNTFSSSGKLPAA